MDFNNGGGLQQLGLEARILPLEAGNLVLLRIARLRGATSSARFEAGQRPLITLGAPLGPMRAVQPVAAEQRATAGVALGVGLILSEDGQPLSGAPFPLLGLGLGRWPLGCGWLGGRSVGAHLYSPPRALDATGFRVAICPRSV